MTTVLSDLKPALENLFSNSALYFSLIVSMSHAGTLVEPHLCLRLLSHPHRVYVLHIENRTTCDILLQYVY
jgi:hypothetical protein